MVLHRLPLKQPGRRFPGHSLILCSSLGISGRRLLSFFTETFDTLEKNHVSYRPVGYVDATVSRSRR